MAARKRLKLAVKTCERIQTSMLINRLQNHVFGRCSMTPTQVSAALKILRKTLPDLMAGEVEYDAAPSYADAIRASYPDDDPSHAVQR